jgi:RNA polymerase sigma-70 factor, ECF subfamily
MSDIRGSEELQLVSNAKLGDHEAFSALFNLHKRRVYSLCLHMSKDVAEAEDLTQDAFMRVYRKLDSFRGDSKFSTWVYRIAVNTVLAKFRRSRAENLSIDKEVLVDASFQRKEGGRTDDQLVGTIDRLTLLRAIEELPPGCRTVFILHDVEGYEHHEVADLLKCSIGNSKAQLHKARIKIRAWLMLPARVASGKPAKDAVPVQRVVQGSTLPNTTLFERGRAQAFQGLKVS